MSITPRGGRVAAIIGVGSGLALFMGGADTSRPPPNPTALGRPAPPAAHEGRLPGYNPDRNAYFGDLHVHTKLSFDAYVFNVRGTPDDAYRYAKGEPLGHPGGFDVRLPTPLDFTAVTDHSEYIGALQHVGDPKDPLHQLPIAQGLFSKDPKEIQQAFNTLVTGYEHNTLPAAFRAKPIIAEAWREI